MNSSTIEKTRNATSSSSQVRSCIFELIPNTCFIQLVSLLHLFSLAFLSPSSASPLSHRNLLSPRRLAGGASIAVCLVGADVN
eukprot:768026-Hanusia_phi.AAC.6